MDGEDCGGYETRGALPHLLVEAFSPEFGRRLPGAAAQRSMAPSHRPSAGDAGAYREAAVLVLCYHVGPALYFPLTLRSDQTRSHKGQVSLPGGAREKGEELVDTALRETMEEIGIDSSAPEILGALSALEVPPSSFRIQPFVAFLHETARFVLERREVAELIEVPLSSLLAADAPRREERLLGGIPAQVPYFLLGGHKVWGATAMILAELRELLGSAPQ